MTVNSVSDRAQWISDQVTQQAREVPAEQENDGDADDGGQAAAARTASLALNPPGVGTRIDILA
jgi:hypothetical protein